MLSEVCMGLIWHASLRVCAAAGELREAFVEFHRSRTEDYGLCRMVTTCEHNRLTREHAGATQE